MTLKVISSGKTEMYEDRKISWTRSADGMTIKVVLLPSGYVLTLTEDDVAYLNNSDGNTIETLRVKKPVKEMKVVK